MSDQHSSDAGFPEVPAAAVKTRTSRFSLVWVVPVAAALIGGWLVVKALTEKGPEITITFRTAEGLEAGKTKIKCKDVEIGHVEEISLSKDLAQVVVKAQLVKETDAYLSENSRFWVVRARVSASSVTGLGTVFSGDYIDIDPGAPGKKARHFTGLEDPPIVTWEKGGHFILQAERKGSLDIGAPVYYRQIEAGRVSAYNLAPDGTSVMFKVFIKDPYPGFVRKNTRADAHAGAAGRTPSDSGLTAFQTWHRSMRGRHYPTIFVPDSTVNGAWWVRQMRDWSVQRRFTNINDLDFTLDELAAGLPL